MTSNHAGLWESLRERKIHDAGRAIDEIARGRLYRLRHLRSMSALLAPLGISRTTAHKWRVVARECGEEAVATLGAEAAYRRARPRAERAPSADADTRRVIARLRALGVDADATPVLRRGTCRVRVELSATEWDRVLRTR